MLTNVCSTYLKIAQKDLINELNEFSKTRPVLGRLGSIPIAVVDVFLDTIKSPLTAFEELVVTVINVAGIIFSEKCTMKDGIASGEFAVKATVNTPVSMLFSPVKLVYQLLLMLWDPVHAKSIDYNVEGYRPSSNLQGVLLPKMPLSEPVSEHEVQDVR